LKYLNFHSWEVSPEEGVQIHTDEHGLGLLSLLGSLGLLS